MDKKNIKVKKGFTLIELLVVIAIIALLLAILLPSLGMAKDHAKKIGCASNLRTLALAVIFYCDDNDGRTPSATNYWSGGVGWCGQTTSFTDGRPPLPNDVQIENLRKGQLWSYVETHKGWRCPADQHKDQLRSYCMAAQWWNNYTKERNTIPVLTKIPDSKPEDEPSIAYKRLSEIKNASSRFLFVDNLGSNADAYSAIWYDKSFWWNIPNFRHRGGSVNGFADGHIETYKFNKETIDHAQRSLDTNINDGFRMLWEDCSLSVQRSEDLKYYQRATWGEIAW